MYKDLYKVHIKNFLYKEYIIKELILIILKI